MNRALLLAAAVATLIGIPDRAVAQHAGKGQARNQDVAAEGAQVAADPQSGKLRPPTREEVEALLQGMKPYLDQSSEGLPTIQGAGGAVGVDLQDRFQNVSVARVTPGGVQTECVTTSAEAREFLERSPSPPETKAPPAPALEEK
jgi:hypothetical protein